ncbi:MAG: hypothetical protein VW397_08765 [Candidatus Margulisiibacteriota bacterium]
MQELKTAYIESRQEIDTRHLKSNAISKAFNIKGTALVGFVNEKSIPSLTFIFEGKCSKHSLLCLSKLFLMTINHVHPNIFEINQFGLNIKNLPASNNYHYATKEKGVFSHSIITRKTKNGVFVAHTPIEAKHFSITVFNHFKTIYQDILNEQ